MKTKSKIGGKMHPTAVKFNVTISQPKAFSILINALDPEHRYYRQQDPGSYTIGMNDDFIVYFTKLPNGIEAQLFCQHDSSESRHALEHLVNYLNWRWDKMYRMYS